jgi:hypothetical protein
MIRGMMLILALVTGIIVAILSIIAVFCGINLASNLDNAACINMVVNDTYITQSSDGFLGIETHYFFTTEKTHSYELETNTNMTDIQRWHDLKKGDNVNIRASENYFVFCDQPKFIPEVFRK